MRFRGIAITVVMLAGGWALPGAAAAYEGQNTLEVGALYIAGPSEDSGQHLVGLDVGVGFGLGDTWTLRTSAAFGMGVGASTSGVDAIVRLSAEALYLIDVVQVVPYLGAGVGALMLIGADAPFQPSVAAVVGLDYLLNRSLFLGAGYRLDWLPLEAQPALHHSVMLRVGWRWDR